jgi:PAS domain S-box-containing protein
MNKQVETKVQLNTVLKETTFSDIFNLAEIQRLQDLFAFAHGVASVITDTNGKPITKPSNFTHLCENIIRKTEKGCANCYKSDAIIGRYNPAGAVVQPCLSGGLWDAGASITVGGKHIANWLIGQVRNEQVDEQQMLQYAVEIGANVSDFKAALENVPIVSAKQFEKIADLLFVFANELSEKAYSNLQLKLQITEQEKINALLQEHEESLYTTLHSIGDGVISTDNNGLIVAMNPVAENLCGWLLVDAVGRHLTEVFKIVNSETRETVANPVKKVLENGEIVGLANHTVLISKNGAEYQIADSAAPIKTKNSEICGVVLVFSDVTEKYSVQKIINDNELRFRGLLGNLEAGIVVHAPNTSVLVSNTRASELLGLSKEQMKGKEAMDPAWKFINEDYSNLSVDNYPVNRISIAKKPIKNQILGILQSNKNYIVWVSVNGFPMFNNANEITEIVISFIDITEKKQADEALKEAEWKFKALFELGPIGVAYHRMIFDEAGNPFDYLFIDANESYNELTGVSPKGMTVRQAFPGIENDPSDWIGKFGHVARTGETIRFEQFLESNGRWYECVGYQYKPDHFVAAFNEVTKRKEAEILLKQSEKEYRSLIELSPLAMTIIKDWKTIYFNPAAVQLFGSKTQNELLGKHIFDFVHPDYHELSIDNAKKLADKGYIDMQEQKYLKQDGGILDVEIQAKSIRFNDDSATLVVINDITERKKAEKHLKESEEKFRNFFENSVVGKSITTLDGKLKVNNAFCSILGYSEDELRSINWRDITHKDDVLYNIKIVDSMLRGEMQSKRWEKRYIHKTGKIVWTDISTTLQRDNDGKPLYFITAIFDITDKKRADEELKDSREQLRNFASNLQKAREEERTNLAREIHDSLAQYLVALKMDLGLFKKKVLKSTEQIIPEILISEIEQLIVQVDNANKSARSIMNGLRPEQLELLGFVEAAEVYLNDFEKNHHIKCKFENTIKKNNIHPDQALALFRILQESLHNTLKHAMATKVAVILTNIEGKLVMEVIDNGVGFDQNHKGRQDSYGLIGIKERVKLLDGNLIITSKVGDGTSVRVEMPYL